MRVSIEKKIEREISIIFLRGCWGSKVGLPSWVDWVEVEGEENFHPFFLIETLPVNINFHLAIRKKLYGDPVYKQNLADIKDRDKRIQRGSR